MAALDHYESWPFCPRCGLAYPTPRNTACDDCLNAERDRIKNRPHWSDCHPTCEAVVMFVVLHVGFLSIIETPEQLAVLGAERTAIKGGAAFSKIERADGPIPRPVDAVARRVLGS